MIWLEGVPQTGLQHAVYIVHGRSFCSGEDVLKQAFVLDPSFLFLKKAEVVQESRQGSMVTQSLGSIEAAGHTAWQ